MDMRALGTVCAIVIVTRAQTSLDGFTRPAEGIERKTAAARRLMDKSAAAGSLFDLILINGFPLSRFHLLGPSGNGRKRLYMLCFIRPDLSDGPWPTVSVSFFDLPSIFPAVKLLILLILLIPSIL